METEQLLYTLVACLLGVVLLYFIGRSNKKDAGFLQRVPRVHQLNALSQLLDLPSTVLPLLVAISGRACSDTPISCVCSTMQGVIVQETKVTRTLQHHVERNNEGKCANRAHNGSGSWRDGSDHTTSVCRTVPWYLDDGSSRVFVLEAQYASGFEYTFKKEVVDNFGRSLGTGTLDNHLGLMELVVKRTEEVLPIGTKLTVVGQVVKDRRGIVRVKKLHNHPFYVSPKPIDQLISDLETWARICEVVSMGFCAVSSILLIVLLYQFHEVVYELMCSFTNNLQAVYEHLGSFFSHETLSTMSTTVLQAFF